MDVLCMFSCLTSKRVYVLTLQKRWANIRSLIGSHHLGLFPPRADDLICARDLSSVIRNPASVFQWPTC